jgi:DNA-binding MarR family transcriptional regulator
VAKTALKVDADACAEAARTCACFNLRKASRAVTALFDEVLEPTSLRSTQFVVLVAIQLNEPISLPALAREMVLDRTTLVRNIQPLVAAKLIATSRSRRSRLFQLTEKGRETLGRVLPYWKQAQARFVAKLGDGSWHELLSLLPRAVDAARTS